MQTEDPTQMHFMMLLNNWNISRRVNQGNSYIRPNNGNGQYKPSSTSEGFIWKEEKYQSWSTSKWKNTPVCPEQQKIGYQSQNYIKDDWLIVLISNMKYDSSSSDKLLNEWMFFIPITGMIFGSWIVDRQDLIDFAKWSGIYIVRKIWLHS